jgi:hypothetical protein
MWHDHGASNARKSQTKVRDVKQSQKQGEGIISGDINLFKAIANYIKTWGIELWIQRAMVQIWDRFTSGCKGGIIRK